MELRPDLAPPAFDPELIVRLTKLADRIDGAVADACEHDLDEFARLSGAATAFEQFQGTYGAEGHEAFVRQLLIRQHLIPLPPVSANEMTEVVSRVMACGPDHDFYLALFEAHCRHPSGADLIFWPDQVREFAEGREPSAAEVAALALRHSGIVGS